MMERRIVPPWQYWASFVPGLFVLPFIVVWGLPVLVAVPTVVICAAFMSVGAFYTGVTVAGAMESAK